MNIKVSLIEDDPRTLATLAQLIDGWPGCSCVSQHLAGAEALETIPSLRPDVVLVDLELGDIPGADCIRRLKSALPKTAFLVFSQHDDANRLFPALQAGASGYLVKGASSPSQLLEGIGAAHRGEAPLSSQIARKMLAYFRQLKSAGSSLKKVSASTGGNAPAPRSLEPGLSEEEIRIVEMFAKGSVTKEVAGKLGQSVRTIHYRLSKIREKLHAANRTEAIAKYKSRQAQELV